MADRLRKQPVISYTPAIPGVVGRPAYCYLEYRQVPVAYGQPGTVVYNLPPVDTYEGTDPSAYLSGGYGTQQPISGYLGQLKTKYVTVQVQVCVPAIAERPPVMASQSVDNKTGWNAGARSKDWLPHDARFAFRISPTAVGAIAGFSDGAPLRTYNHVSHGFLATRGEVSIIESGTVVFETSVDLAPAPLLSVTRRLGVVTYEADGVAVYTSKKGSAGPVYGEATLHTVGDFVEDPTLEPLVVGGTILGYVRPVFLASNYAMQEVNSTLPVPTFSAVGRQAVVLSGRLPAPQAVIWDREYQLIDAQQPKIQFVAKSSGPALGAAILGGRVPPPMLSGLSIAGEKGDLLGNVPVIRGLISDRPYAEMGGTWPSRYTMGVWENFDAPDEAGDTDLVITRDFVLADFPLVVVALDSLDVSSEATFVLVADVEAYDYLALSDSLSLSGVLDVLVNSALAVGDAVDVNRRVGIQYAVNILTGALTEYAGYNFEHFARCAGETYAGKPDGLYVLRGGVDDGEAISASVDFGTTDWGNSSLKRFETAYVGINTDGQVFLRITAESGRERTYAVRGESDMRKSTLAKGLRARQWSVKLDLVDATEGLVDLIELRVGVTKRRIGGRRT